MITKKLQNILITGGTGFVGSAFVPLLLNKGYHVTVADRLSASKTERIESYFSHDNFEFIKLDLLDEEKINGVIRECDLVFHLAANVDVRTGCRNTDADFQDNIVATRNVLESMRKSDSCKRIVFTSSSVVYGEPPVIPTPETFGPLKPISLYGASKLASEALISGYVGTFGLSAIIFRLANVVGPHSGRGVIFDFIRKLQQSNGKYLEILGDGNQSKSYLYIDDCINALALGLRKFSSSLEIFNVGSDDQVDVNTIAKIIIDQFGLQPEITYSESNDGRGWIGDVKNMLLSTEKLKNFGWRIRHTSEDSVLLTVKRIMDYEQIKRK